MPRNRKRGSKGRGVVARQEARRLQRLQAAQDARAEARVAALQAAGASRPDGPVPYLLAAVGGVGMGSPRGTYIPSPSLTGWCSGGREPSAAEQALLDSAAVEARLLDGAGRLTPAGEEWLLLQQRRAPALTASRRRAEEANPEGPLADQAQALGDEGERARTWRAAGDWARQLAAGSGLGRRAEEFARVPAAGTDDEAEAAERASLMRAVRYRCGRLTAGRTLFVPRAGLTVAEAVGLAEAQHERAMERRKRPAGRVVAERIGDAHGQGPWWLGLAAAAAAAAVALVWHLPLLSFLRP